LSVSTLSGRRLPARLLLAGWLFLAPAGVAGTFRAGVAKVDITPETPQWLLGYQARQSDGVHDRLHHRIVALDDGNTQLFLVSSDLALASPGYYDQVCADIEKAAGIQPRQIWWLFTHTHSAPEVGPPGLPVIFMPERYKQASGHMSNPEYSAWAEQKLIEGLKEARARLEPARLGFGLGFAQANINRRARDADGKISLGLNPYGPVDRQIGLILVERPDGTPLALIANYAIHGTVLGSANLKISADAPGVVAEYVEAKLGAPMLFINGAEGNIAPIYSVYPTPGSGHLSEFRVLLGDRILEARRKITATIADVQLWTGERFIETPLREGLAWPAELSRYAREADAGRKLVRIPVRALRLHHDLVVWGAPLELFCEIALRVREESPFPDTYYFGLLNGWLGYLPTARAIREGGYEPSVSPYSEKAEEDFSRGVSAWLREIPR